MPEFCLINTVTVECRRVPRGEAPVYSFELEPHQEVLAFTETCVDREKRATVDWVARITVLSRLGEVVA